MCGVNVIIDKTHKIDYLPIEKMNEALRSRGPDGCGVQMISLDQANVFIGNTRLEIRGEEESMRQPLCTESGILSYNGELYSYDNGKRVPAADSLFLLNWLAANDLRSLGSVNGMFSFAYHPKGTAEVWIARDTNGIKPLFIYESQDYSIISSEIKGILASGLMEVHHNLDQIRRTLELKHPVRPETAYHSIREIEPGACIELLSRKQISCKQSVPEHNQVDFRELWQEEVERQLISNHPVGVFLSGGIDSTLILAAVRALGHTDFPTFSISNGKDEIRQIEKVSSQFQSNHINYTINPTWEDWTGFIQYMDQPIGDSGAFLTYLLAKEVRQKVKVVLSGAGADEFFAGYNRHVAFQYYLRGGSALQQLAPFKKLASLADYFGKDYSRLGSKFLSGIDMSPAQTYANFVSTLKTTPLPVISLDDALEYDRNHYLVSDVLAISDMATMSNGVELRVPFLGQAVTQYARSLSGKELLRKRRKWLLKDLLRSYGGGSLIDYPKRGFGIDRTTLSSLSIYHQLFDLDFRSLLSDYVDEVYLDLLTEDPDKIEIPLLWNLLITAHWIELHK